VRATLIALFSVKKSAARKATPTRRVTAPKSPATAAPPQPIGVFDSGIGGLTVVAELRRLLPAESIFYIGDTARVPYGGKSQATIERYSQELAGLLLAERAKLIVVACNTASALGVPRLKETLRVPVTGVIEPGAQAAVKATRSGKVGVIGTRATIASRAYERAIAALDPAIKVFTEPCPLLVPLIEEGWLDDPVTDSVIARYLEKLLRTGVDTLVLGCTHYPLLRDAIQRFTGPGITLVDSAHNTALAVQKLLRERNLAAPAPAASSTRSGTRSSAKPTGTLHVALTDQSSAFLRVAEQALGLKVGNTQLRAVQHPAG
jgi:glutamate racemase